MPKSQYEKYYVRKPTYESCPGVKNRQSPTMTLMSSKQVPEANYYIQVGWINGMPDPNPHVYEHVHDYDEILLHIGGNYETPQVLGGEIEFYIGGQPITFNTTTGIFIPAGTPHGPVTWKKFEYPHIQLSMILGTGDPAKAFGKSGIKDAKKTLPKKTKKFDYEQYVIRSPMRESGAFFTSGRQAPTMTYMSKTQIGVADTYIEFGWIWDTPNPQISRMVHRKYDEIVLHIGGDPKNPEDLGADMQFGMEGDLMDSNTTFGVYIPRGIIHGPLLWPKVRKPHIEMAIMLGCPTMLDGWGDSERFDDLPPKK